MGGSGFMVLIVKELCSVYVCGQVGFTPEVANWA